MHGGLASKHNNFSLVRIQKQDVRCHPICNLVEQLMKLASQHIELLSHVERFEYLMVVSKAINIKIEIMEYGLYYKEI